MVTAVRERLEGATQEIDERGGRCQIEGHGGGTDDEQVGEEGDGYQEEDRGSGSNGLRQNG